MFRYARQCRRPCHDIDHLTGSSCSAVTVVRPIGVSAAFMAVVPLVCHSAVKPRASKLRSSDANLLRFLISKSQVASLIHTIILLGFVAGSSYASTSNLFSAYLAGTCISWYDSEIIKAPEWPLITEDFTIAKGVTNAQVKVGHQEMGDSGYQKCGQGTWDVDTHEIVTTPHSMTEPWMRLSHAASANGDTLKSKFQFRTGC